MQGAESVSGGGFVDDAKDGNASGYAGFEADGQVAGDGESEEFVSVLGKELFVGGDHGLAVLEGSAEKFEGVFDSAHGFDNDVDVGGVEELAPAGGDPGAGRYVFRLYGLAATDGGDVEMDSAALLDKRGVVGDDVGSGAADGSESDNAYTDVFHKKSCQVPVVSGQ